MALALAVAQAAFQPGNAVSASAIDRLPDTPGLYAISANHGSSTNAEVLLYVGRSDNVRKRIREYLIPKRPNETLCLISSTKSSVLT